jgi:hypothetical protein
MAGRRPRDGGLKKSLRSGKISHPMMNEKTVTRRLFPVCLLLTAGVVFAAAGTPARAAAETSSERIVVIDPAVAGSSRRSSPWRWPGA